MRSSLERSWVRLGAAASNATLTFTGTEVPGDSSTSDIIVREGSRGSGDQRVPPLLTRTCRAPESSSSPASSSINDRLSPAGSAVLLRT